MEGRPSLWPVSSAILGLGLEGKLVLGLVEGAQWRGRWGRGYAVTIQEDKRLGQALAGCVHVIRIHSYQIWAFKNNIRIRGLETLKIF